MRAPGTGGWLASKAAGAASMWRGMKSASCSSATASLNAVLMTAMSCGVWAVVKKQGKLSPGIYQRFTFASGSAIKPIMYFVRMPAYKRRLDFYGIANKVAVDTFNKAYPMYLDKLLRERGL